MLGRFWPFGKGNAAAVPAVPASASASTSAPAPAKAAPVAAPSSSAKAANKAKKASYVPDPSTLQKKKAVFTGEGNANANLRKLGYKVGEQFNIYSNDNPVFNTNTGMEYSKGMLRYNMDKDRFLLNTELPMVWTGENARGVPYTYFEKQNARIYGRNPQNAVDTYRKFRNVQTLRKNVIQKNLQKKHRAKVLGEVEAARLAAIAAAEEAAAAQLGEKGVGTAKRMWPRGTKTYITEPGSAPAARTPAPITPAARTPAPITPAARTPAPITPAARTPAPITPAARTPAGPENIIMTQNPLMTRSLAGYRPGGLLESLRAGKGSTQSSRRPSAGSAGSAASSRKGSNAGTPKGNNAAGVGVPIRAGQGPENENENEEEEVEVPGNGASSAAVPPPVSVNPPSGGRRNKKTRRARSRKSKTRKSKGRKH